MHMPVFELVSDNIFKEIIKLLLIYPRFLT